MTSVNPNTATYCTFRDENDLRVVFHCYPAGLEAFGTLSTRSTTGDDGSKVTTSLVHVVCPGGDGSGYDLTPVLVACDWIRDQDWEVKNIK